MEPAIPKVLPFSAPLFENLKACKKTGEQF
jgi:hypothetical protein